jgi:hypothetical protein
MPNRDDMIDNIMLKSNAYQNPSTKNPVIKWLASMIMDAFITSRNKPNVKMVIGMVRSMRIGLRNAFNKARTNATMMAVLKIGNIHSRQDISCNKYRNGGDDDP